MSSGECRSKSLGGCCGTGPENIRALSKRLTVLEVRVIRRSETKSDIQAIGGAGFAIEALLTYTTDTGERVVYHITETSEDEDNPVILERHAVHQMPIHDLRAVADGLSLDREGFILRRSASAVADFYDADEVSAVYDPEVERLVEQQTGAEKVVIFDHTIRVESDEKRDE